VNLMRIAHRLGDEERTLAPAREVVTIGAQQGSPVTTAHALDGIAWVKGTLTPAAGCGLPPVVLLIAYKGWPGWLFYLIKEPNSLALQRAEGGRHGREDRQAARCIRCPARS